MTSRREAQAPIREGKKRKDAPVPGPSPYPPRPRGGPRRPRLPDPGPEGGSPLAGRSLEGRHPSPPGSCARSCLDLGSCTRTADVSTTNPRTLKKKQDKSSRSKRLDLNDRSECATRRSTAPAHHHRCGTHPRPRQKTQTGGRKTATPLYSPQALEQLLIPLSDGISKRDAHARRVRLPVVPERALAIIRAVRVPAPYPTSYPCPVP